MLAKWLFRKKLLVRCGYEAYRNALQAKDPLLRKLFLRSISLISYWQANQIWLNTLEIAEFVSKNSMLVRLVLLSFQTG